MEVYKKVEAFSILSMESAGRFLMRNGNTFKQVYRCVTAAGYYGEHGKTHIIVGQYCSSKDNFDITTLLFRSKISYAKGALKG
jgi:hypothetical protein